MKRCDNLISIRGKRGQFYLVAAIIIVAAIVGFATVTNSAKRADETRVYDLGEELEIEGDQVMEHGVINPDVQIEEIMTNFSRKYSAYVQGGNLEIIFVFGNKDNLNKITFTDFLRGSISDSGSTVEILDSKIKKEKVEKTANDKVKINIGKINHEFDLKPGENFYYVISQDHNDGSTSVVKG